MTTTLKWLKPIIIQEYFKWKLSMMPRYIPTVHLWMENTESLSIMGVSNTSNYITIKIKMPNPSPEPPASTKAQNEDLKDM